MDECQRVVNELGDKEIEVFINNAGFGYCGETLNIETDTELNMIDLNVKAMHLLSKLILAKMVTPQVRTLSSLAQEAKQIAHITSARISASVFFISKSPDKVF